VTTIEQLESRIAALEARTCECPHCIGKAQRLDEERTYQRAASLAALPAEERNAALAALDGDEFRKLVPLMNPITEIVLDAPRDLGERILACHPPIERHKANLEHAQRNGKLVHSVEVKPVHPLTRISAHEIIVTDEQHTRLARAGFDVAKKRAPVDDWSQDWREQWHVEIPDLHRNGRIYTREQWELLAEIDPEVRNALGLGRLEIRDLTPDEDKDRMSRLVCDYHALPNLLAIPLNQQAGAFPFAYKRPAPYVLGTN
jgi:hypothetical protein